MRVEALVSPRNQAEIIEDDPDALFLKSFMTGDIFTDVSDPDAPDNDPDRTITVAIVGHPCAIRQSGGKLARRVPCCLVGVNTNPIEFDEWPERQFDLFPLGDVLGTGEHQAVRLAEFRPVRDNQLLRSRRIAALTPRGIYLFQQRFAHSLTRVGFQLKAFEDGSKHIVEEAELEVEWVEEFAADERDDKVIGKHVKTFHSFLDQEVEGQPRRAMLKREGGQSALRKQLRAEIKRLGSEAR